MTRIMYILFKAHSDFYKEIVAFYKNDEAARDKIRKALEIAKNLELEKWDEEIKRWEG